MALSAIFRSVVIGDLLRCAAPIDDAVHDSLCRSPLASNTSTTMSSWGEALLKAFFVCSVFRLVTYFWRKHV
jgi:hypothetical protein